MPLLGDTLGDIIVQATASGVEANTANNDVAASESKDVGALAKEKAPKASTEADLQVVMDVQLSLALLGNTQGHVTIMHVFRACCAHAEAERS